jgi:hypothetical protein
MDRAAEWYLGAALHRENEGATARREPADAQGVVSSLDHRPDQL